MTMPFRVKFFVLNTHCVFFVKKCAITSMMLGAYDRQCAFFNKYQITNNVHSRIY